MAPLPLTPDRWRKRPRASVCRSALLLRTAAGCRAAACASGRSTRSARRRRTEGALRARATPIRAGRAVPGRVVFTSGQADVILDILDTRYAVRNVLERVAHPPLHNRPVERNDPLSDFDGHLAYIEIIAFGQPLAEVFLDAFVGTLPTLGTPTRGPVRRHCVST